MSPGNRLIPTDAVPWALKASNCPALPYLSRQANPAHFLLKKRAIIPVDLEFCQSQLILPYYDF